MRTVLVVFVVALLGPLAHPAGAASHSSYELTLPGVDLRPGTGITADLHATVFVNRAHPCNGSVALTIHGLLHTAATWEPFVASLFEENPAGRKLCRVVALDMPGVAEARNVVAEALAEAETTGERYYEPELHRLQGEALLAAGGPPSDAERCFREAIRIAREQLARSWELRATTSLARTCIGQGRRAEAQDAVSAIYGWFTEGFETPDLRAARALLHSD
jgi:hypothetical protein